MNLIRRKVIITYSHDIENSLLHMEVAYYARTNKNKLRGLSLQVNYIERPLHVGEGSANFCGLRGVA
jgi:hypothetical protein